MSEPLRVRTYRIAFGLLAIVAVIAHNVHHDDSIANWLSKFTIQANTIAGVTLIAGGVLSATIVRSVRWDRIRGAVLMYMVMTFIVYGFLVNSFDNPFNTTRHWTHTVLHQVIPVVLVLDLIIRPFATRLSWSDAFRWAVYPILYLIYSLVRGAATGWYPYDFIDPSEVGGYVGVVLYTLGITAGFFALGLPIIWLSHLHDRRKDSLERAAVSESAHS